MNTSLEDASFVENLNVYPNPVADILNIDMKIKAGTEYEVFVTNTMGAPVTTITQNTNFINVANLAAGMYFLNVKTNEGIFAHKFTKI
ncbi:MAG: T9SS type A sorting domain-containing protein [Saprospiraceae bacterium]|nr:T9SS type A sorting domain-containing protein [Saprospiraceae bacterium]